MSIRAGLLRVALSASTSIGWFIYVMKMGAAKRQLAAGPRLRVIDLLVILIGIRIRNESY